MHRVPAHTPIWLVLAGLATACAQTPKPCTGPGCLWDWDDAGGGQSLHTADTGADTADVASGQAQDVQPYSPDSSLGSAATTARCQRWLADRADLDEGTWTGATALCDAGGLTAPALANTLKLVNLARFLADVPAVGHDSALDQQAQACSMLMAANGDLSHDPPSTWKCWNAEADDAAKHSNLSTAPAVQSVGNYLIDAGNDTTLGHRRWILSNSLGPIGIGGTTSASCLWVIGGTGKGAKTWTAWPAPGVFPLQAFTSGWGPSLDVTGWSIQSDALNLDKATVHVTVAGVEKPVTTRVLKAGYGSAHAIAFTPKGWQAQAATTYHVAVTGAGKDFTYDVQVTNCGK